ncbi:50S ribosomal protein L10 [Candidatus Karelsulcia muelleri]|uniref:50S ribosomal protein L10 n=1 Tax=Candidatus Karelsulcia muelleri TaxID=336810 RepID=UPI00195017C6|nr:50S ribosomal protein L10 [Candidatus Karelsulcia muelleri]
MKPNNKKKIIIYFRDLLLNQSLNFYFLNIKGLKASQQAYLRKKSNKNKIKIKVVTNTLLKKSIELTNNSKLLDIIPFIRKNTTLMWSQFNKAPAELLLKFIKKDKLSLKKIFKLALSENNLYFGEKSLKDLRNVKSKKELLTLIIKNIKILISKNFLFLKKISILIFRLKLKKVYKNEN